MGEFQRRAHRSSRRSGGLSWLHIGITAVATILAVLFAWQGYQRHVQRTTVQAIQDITQRSQERIERRERAQRRQREDDRERQAAERALKPGERCLAGKFIYAIPGGWADDPTQDWKCGSPRSTH